MSTDLRHRVLPQGGQWFDGFASTLPRPARRVEVAPGRGFDSRISPASTVRCMSAEREQGEAEFLDARSSAPTTVSVRMKRRRRCLRARTKLGELSIRRTRPPVENRRPSSSTRGRAQPQPTTPSPMPPKRSGCPGGSAPGPRSGSRAWRHEDRCTRPCSGQRPRRQRLAPRDGHRGRHVRTPQRRAPQGDGPVVRLRPVRVTRALRGLEVVPRINRRTRSFEVRRPSTRNFAHTFR